MDVSEFLTNHEANEEAKNIKEQINSEENYIKHVTPEEEVHSTLDQIEICESKSRNFEKEEFPENNFELDENTEKSNLETLVCQKEQIDCSHPLPSEELVNPKEDNDGSESNPLASEELVNIKEDNDGSESNPLASEELVNIKEDNDGSESNDKSHSLQKEDNVDSSFYTQLQNSKYPIVLVEKLNNLHCGIGYDAKLYESVQVGDNASEKLMEEAFSQFIIPVTRDQFKCTACGYIGRNKPHAIRHSLIHLNVKLYKCTECSYESSRKDKYKVHLKKKHNAPLYECKFCDFVTNQKGLIDKHNVSHQSQKFNWRKKRKKRSKTNSFSQKFHSNVKKGKKRLRIEPPEERFSEITRFEDGLYICAVCNYKTKSKDRAKRHSIIHTDMWYLCSECDSEFIGKDVYEAHIKDFHKNKILYKCNYCEFSCSQKKEYATHISSHTKESGIENVNDDEKLYSCEECDYKTRYQNHLVRHNRVHTAHKNPSKRKLLSKNSSPSQLQINKYLDDFTESVIEVTGHLYKCTLCSYVSANKHHTKRHSLIHSETKVYKCTDCKFASNRKDKCKEHMRKIHPGKLREDSSLLVKQSGSETFTECTFYDTESSNSTPTSKKLFQCYECSFQTMFRSHLSKHQLRHIKRKETMNIELMPDNIKEEITLEERDRKNLEEELKINETFYSENTTNPFLLTVDIKTEYTEENIKEDPTELLMVRHIKTESEPFLVLEDSIADSFLTENEITPENNSDSMSSTETHIIPCDAKLLQCLDCNFTTYDEKCLGTHLCCKTLDDASQNNENKKLFTCTECTYSTFRLKQLAAHIVAHSSLKSFKCTECDFQTIYRNNLKTHLLTHTNIKLFNCTECSYQTNYKSHLKKHQTVHKKKKLTNPESEMTEISVSHELLSNGWTNSDMPVFSDSKVDPPEINSNFEKLLTCTKCSYQSKQETELKEHLLTHFSHPITVFTEDTSPEEKTNHFKEQRIESENLEILKPDINTNLYSCSQCDFKASKKTALRKHAIVHSTIQYKCPECNFRTKYRSNLKPHLQTHMVDKLFKCSVCSYETNYKKNMSKHLQSHGSSVKVEPNFIPDGQSVSAVAEIDESSLQTQLNTVMYGDSQEGSISSSDFILWPL